MSYMFDQPSYQQPAYEQHSAAGVQPADGEFLRNYEIKSWVLSPRLYKILALSAVLNISVVLFAAQTSLLTRKGCDSPLVGSVCQVLDTVYVGSLLFGTPRDVVDVAYERTRLNDDDDITFVDVTKDTPPLTYPEGYFAIANPEQQDLAMLIQNGDVDGGGGSFTTGNIPGIPPGLPMSRPGTGNSIFDTPQKLPPRNPSVIDGSLPGMEHNNHGSANPPGIRGGKGRGGRIIPPGAASPSPSPEEQTADTRPPKAAEPEPTPMSSEAVMGVQINKRPLYTFTDDVAAKWEAKEIDLNQDFILVMNGVLKDGKLDPKKSKYDVSKQKGDQKMIDVGKMALEAISDSGWLTYLESFKVDKITATLAQDDDKVLVQIVSVQPSPDRARSVASGLNSYISIGKAATQDPSDERTLLNGANVTSQGNTFILNFMVPKPVAQEMITRKLREAQAKKAQQAQPGVAQPPKPATPAG